MNHSAAFKTYAIKSHQTVKQKYTNIRENTNRTRRKEERKKDNDDNNKMQERKQMSGTEQVI